MNTLLGESVQRLHNLQQKPAEHWLTADLVLARDLLPHAILDLEFLEGYLATLSSRSSSALRPLFPVLGTVALSQSTPRISFGELEQAWQGGPNYFAKLQANELSRWLNSPFELQELHDMLSEELPTNWVAHCLAKLVSDPTLAEPSRSVNWRRIPQIPTSWLTGVLALSLLFNVGLILFRGLSFPTEEVSSRIKVATNLGRSIGPRGAEADPKSLFIQGNRGYATVILLKPSRPPEVNPGPGFKPLKLEADRSLEYFLDSSDFGPNHAAVIVVTPNPIHLMLYQELSEQKVDPNNTSMILDRVRTLLTSWGYESPNIQLLELK